MGMQQMCLAQAGIAIDHERIVELPRIIAAGNGSGVCLSIALSDDEVIKGV